MKNFVIALSALLAFGFTACKEDASSKVKEENVEIAAQRDQNGTVYPVMDFEETEYDFGTIQKGENVEHIFKFTNTGKAPLVIVDATSSCGCTVPEYSKDPVQPGQTGELLVKYNGSGTNAVSKTVTIKANTESGSEQLKIMVFVAPKAGDNTVEG